MSDDLEYSDGCLCSDFDGVHGECPVHEIVLRAQLIAYAAEIERLKAALRPFAEAAERCPSYIDDDEVMMHMSEPARKITVGHLREARAAMKETK